VYLAYLIRVPQGCIGEVGGTEPVVISLVVSVVSTLPAVTITVTCIRVL
jgi:hypothetical protein